MPLGRGVGPLFCVLTLGLAACGPTVDLAKGLEVRDVTTGWFDAGIVGGQNKLVPSISFTVKNVSEQKLVVLQVNVLFHRVTEREQELGAGFRTLAGSEGLDPGMTTSPVVIRSELGYTGSGETREEMLRNSHFVDVEAELFAKYGSTQWKRIGGYPVTRRLITR